MASYTTLITTHNRPANTLVEIDLYSFVQRFAQNLLWCISKATVEKKVT